MWANSSASFHYFLNDCFDSRTTVFIYLSFVVTNILLLVPVFTLMLYLSLRRRHSSATEATSHSDFFTYHMVALELHGMLGSALYCVGAWLDEQPLRYVGMSVCSVTSSGQTLFHVLSSLERYLAVVHPVAYLGLRRAGGVRLRNISAGGVWLLCLSLTCFSMLLRNVFGSVVMSCILVFSLVVVSLSGFSILAVLNNPGPGGAGERVNPAKLRAFHTVAAIMAALLLRFAGVLLCNAMFTPPDLNLTRCAVGASAVWLTLPCSLVLPLLFLQRAGRLPGCRRSSDEG